jgi:hypothetical protein
MPSKVLFAPMAFTQYKASQTLPEKFSRMLKKSGLAEKLKGKKVAIKMHVGNNVSYSTIPPIFVRRLVSFIKESGGECFVTDHYVYPRHPEDRGYTDNTLGWPGARRGRLLRQVLLPKAVVFKTSATVDVAGLHPRRGLPLVFPM